MTNTIKSYKVLLVGDGEVGKSTLLAKVRNGSFLKEYNSTMGVEVYPIHMGDVTLRVWDVAGQEKLGGLYEGYYIKADAVVFMYDGTNPLSQRNITNWAQGVKRVCGEIPYIVVRNKADISPQIDNLPESELDISCKVGDTARLPFERIIEKLAALEV